MDNPTIYLLYKPDFECPERLGMFESQELAYQYIKTMYPKAVVYPVDTQDKKEFNYGITEQILYNKIPDIYVSITVYLDPVSNEAVTDINFLTPEDWTRYGYKERVEEDATSIRVCTKLEDVDEIKSISEELMKIFKEKKGKIRYFVKTSIGLFQDNTFWEKVEHNFRLDSNGEDDSYYTLKETGEKIAVNYSLDIYELNEDGEIEGETIIV